MISDLIASSDFHTSYAILIEVAHHLKTNKLDELFGLTTGNDRFQAIVEKARATHGDLMDKFLAVLDEEERQMNIIGRRNTITGEEHRFFLALLLNVTSREKILDLVKHRFPENDPVEKILDWVEELGQTRVLGSKEPNALGIEGFGDEHIIALEHHLRGQPMTELNSNGSERSMLDPTAHKDSVHESLQRSTLFRAVIS
jgi:hypothetical protein